MSMGAGVDGGSELVPEVVWASMVSMSVVGGLLMSMLIPGMSIFVAGISGAGACFVCACVERAASMASGSEIAASLCMGIFLLWKTALRRDSAEARCETWRGQSGIRFEARSEAGREAAQRVLRRRV